MRGVRIVLTTGRERRAQHTLPGWIGPLRRGGARIPQALAVGVSTRSGQLKAVKQGRDWMIDENDVEAFKRPARGPKGPRTKE